MQKKSVNQSQEMAWARPLLQEKNSSTRRKYVCHESREFSLFEKVELDVPFRAAQISLSEYLIVFGLFIYFVYVI